MAIGIVIIVDLPFFEVVVFHSYVNVYQRVLGTNIFGGQNGQIPTYIARLSRLDVELRP
jgi:hypothetical protein